MSRIKISETLFTCDELTPEDLEALPKEGVRALLDLRSKDVSEGAASVEERARALGLAYARLPASGYGEAPDSRMLDEMRRVLARLPGPTLVHGSSARIATIYAIAHDAILRRATGDQALAQVKALGIDLVPDRLGHFLRGYVEYASRPEATARLTQSSLVAAVAEEKRRREGLASSLGAGYAPGGADARDDDWGD